MFSKQREHLDTLSRLAASDKAFEEFVLRHIDVTLPVARGAAVADHHCL